MNIDAFTICGALSAKKRYFSRSDLIGTIQSCLAGKGEVCRVVHDPW